MDTNDGKSATSRKTTELGLLKIHADLIPFYTEKRDLVKVDTTVIFHWLLGRGRSGYEISLYSDVFFVCRYRHQTCR